MAYWLQPCVKNLGYFGKGFSIFLMFFKIFKKMFLKNA